VGMAVLIAMIYAVTIIFLRCLRWHWRQLLLGEAYKSPREAIFSLSFPWILATLVEVLLLYLQLGAGVVVASLLSLCPNVVVAVSSFDAGGKIPLSLGTCVITGVVFLSQQ